MKKRKEIMKEAKHKEEKIIRERNSKVFRWKNENRSGKEKDTQPAIIDFIKKVRFDNEKQKQNEVQVQENEELGEISTQEMMEDSRERRNTKKNEFVCDKCETLLTKHKERKAFTKKQNLHVINVNTSRH